MSSISARDRLVLIGLAAVAVLAAAWMLAVSPARKQASKLDGEVLTARSQLAQAQTEAVEARSAQQRYRSAYASLASLGTAVPTTQEIPSLMYTLDRAANHNKVNFASITNSAATSSSGSSTPASSSSSTPPSSSSTTASSSTPAAPPFSQVPFSLVFTGNYQDLIRLLTKVEAFTVQTTRGDLRVSGRLLTIQSIQLGSEGSSGSGASASGSGSEQGKLSWTIIASAYVLAPSTTAPQAPAAGAAGSQPTSAPATPSGGGSSAAATPAVVRVGG
jgi:Tfp pilus assembly protein PilO